MVVKMVVKMEVKMGVNSLLRFAQAQAERSWKFLDVLAPRRDCSRGKKWTIPFPLKGGQASQTFVQHEVLNFQPATLA